MLEKADMIREEKSLDLKGSFFSSLSYELNQTEINQTTSYLPYLLTKHGLHVKFLYIYIYKKLSNQPIN